MSSPKRLITDNNLMTWVLLICLMTLAVFSTPALCRGQHPRAREPESKARDTRSLLFATRPRRIYESSRSLPQIARRADEIIKLAPALDLESVPSADPVSLAVANILGEEPSSKGGVWLSGDVSKGMDLLCWIAGSNHKDLLYLGYGGRVGFHASLLAAMAGADKLSGRRAVSVIVDYISSNEGLLLLTQITQGRYKYLLRISPFTPTLKGREQVTGALNLDNNFDSRINPRRPRGQKMGNERPPDGFDSLVAANPKAVWLNVPTQQVVGLERVLFHELAEAHGKVALGLDYLPLGGRPGAHDVAVGRELSLGLQRRDYGGPLAVGVVQVITKEEE